MKIPFFTIGFTISAIIFFFLSRRSLKERGIPESDSEAIALMIIISSVVFSKVPLGIIYGWEFEKYLRFWESGHTLFGGILISALLVFIYASVRGLNFTGIMAGLTYPSLLTLSAYRFFVCLPSGCCFGFPSDFGIVFSHESWAGKVFGGTPKLFPSQIVESLLFLAGGIMLKLVERKRKKDEDLILIFLLFLSVERFIAELIRYDIKEKIIKAGEYGISIWFFLSITLFSATAVYFKLFLPWIRELRKVFGVFIFVCGAMLLTASCGQKTKKDLSDITDFIRSAYSFAYPLVFVSYIFLKVKGFLGSCAEIIGDEVRINCGFDVRTLFSSGFDVKGRCRAKTSDGEPSLELSLCKISASSEGIIGEIEGDAKIKGYTVHLKDVKFSLTNTEKLQFFDVLFPYATAKIMSFEAGESIRNFELTGKSVLGETEITVEKIYVRDEGVGRFFISPQGEVEISGCRDYVYSVRTEIKIEVGQDGCPKSGTLLFKGEKVFFGEKITYGGGNIECTGTCPLINF